MRQALFHHLHGGVFEVARLRPGQPLGLLDLHVPRREAFEGVEQVDRPVGKRGIDERGEIAPEDAELRRVARDLLLVDLFGQKAHGRSSGVKDLQRVRAQQLSLEAEFPELRFHLGGPLPVQHAEADAVRVIAQALPRGDHRDPCQGRSPLPLVIIRKT